MSITKIEYCPITDKPIIDLIISSNYVEYSINFENHYIIRLGIVEGWNPTQDIKPNEKVVFQAMLYNNEWPLEKETIITPDLISQIIHLGDYPKDFDEKLNYYMLKCYLNGGKEYKPIDFDITRKLETFAFDDNEYARIFKALQSKEFITLPSTSSVLNKNSNRKLSLTEKGIRFAENLNNTKILNTPKWFPSSPKPRITIIATKEDEFYAEKLKRLLAQYGISVVSTNGLDESQGFSTVSNIKSGLYSSENDYIIFIKSKTSDINNSFGSILDIAIEAHENTDKRSFKYIYIACIDDSIATTRPRIDNYRSSFYDFRITSNRKNLVLDIQKDWEKRTNEKQNINKNKSSQTRKFNFPKITLKEGEEYWIKLLYENFISGKQRHYNDFISLHWKNLPKNFDPTKIDSRLLNSGNNITFYGIWAIYPTSIYVKGVEDLILAIKAILEEQGKPQDFWDDLLLKKLDYSLTDLNKFLELLSRYGGFMQFYTSKPDGSQIQIKIQNDEELNAFNEFTTLEDSFRKKYPEFQKVNPAKNSLEDNSREVLNKQIDIKNPHSFKTKFIYRDKNDITPVMGVTELSVDLAEIIDTLPIDKEKGQMIGIFGKWGRGKTFLLKEIWSILEKKKETKYIKIEYHAWKYQETPASWAYLYENFVSEYLGKKKNLGYLFRLVKLNIKRLGYFPVIKFLLVIIASVIAPEIFRFYFSGFNWYKMLGIYSASFALGIGILSKMYKEFRVKAIDLIKKYSIKNSFRENLGIQADIQDELIKLLKVWIPLDQLGKKKILLVVEDIDRCTEDKIIQNIDALRVMLEDEEISKRVIIITAIDERILKNAIRLKYKSILFDYYNDPHEEGFDPLDGNINKLISEYLDKLFISAIKLGGLTSGQRNEYLNELLKQETEEKTLKETNSTKDEMKEKMLTAVSPIIADALIKDEMFIQMQGSNQLATRILTETGADDLDLAIEDGDFVIKDGDFALKGSDGRITSMPEMEKDYQERLISQNKFEKLSNYEILLIKEVVERWANATPRRIRIFYYRYLLSKNLLINKYSILQRVNVWQDKQGIKAMMFLILEYAKKHHPNSISEAKADLHTITANKKITLTIDNGNIVITPYEIDYLFLLEVLELVIAY